MAVAMHVSAKRESLNPIAGGPSYQGKLEGLSATSAVRGKLSA